MTTNIAEVLKLAAKPVKYDNDEKTWLEFRFKLENYLTLVDERYVGLLLDAESQPVANLPTGTEESAVTIRTLSHTLYALLATLTTGRSLRLVQRVPNRNGFEVWRQMAAENAPKTAGRRFAMLQAVLQPGMSDNPGKFEETWKSWEHQMDIYENLSSTKLDDDVKISVVLRECPQKLRDHLLVNSQQFESNYDRLRAIIQAFLNTNKTWIVNDFRETVPMDVDYIGKSKGKGKSKSKSKGKSKGKSGNNSKGKSKGKSKDRNQGKGKGKINSKGKGKGKPSNDKECYVCGKKGHLARDCWSRANHDKMVNEVEVEDPNAEPDEEYVYTIDHEVNVVDLSQSGCGVNNIKEKKTARVWDPRTQEQTAREWDHPRTQEQTAREWDPKTHESLVMVDSGASVNVCPKWFGNTKLEQSDDATCLRGANGKTLQEYGKRRICLKICGQTKQYDFHVVDVTKPILSASSLCEHGAETHLAKESFLRFGNEHEPLIRKGGVYFVKVQTVNSCVRADGCTEKTDAYKQTDSRKTDAYKQTDSRKTDVYELMDSQKTDAYELMDSQKTDAYELMDSRKTDAYKLMDSRRTDAYKQTDSRKTDAYELMDSRKTDAYKLMDSQKTDANELTDSRKTDAYKLMDSRKTDAYELMDSQKIDAYELMDAQKIDAYKMTGAQKKKSDEYEMTDAQKSHEYKMTGAQKKKSDEYEMTDAQKSHEYKMTGAQKKKSDEYEMTDAQKIDAYEMTGAQKSHEYEMTGAQKIDAYKMTGAQKKKIDAYELTDAQKIDACKMTGAQKKKIDSYELTDARKSHAYKMTGAQKKKNDGYEMTDAQKTDAYEMTDAQKTDAYEMTDAQKKKIDAYKLTDAEKQKTDVYELMDSQKKIDAYKMTGAQKSHEYELTDAQKKKADEYELTDAQKKKTDVYKLMDSQKKTDAYKLMDSQKKTDAYKTTGAQKNHEYEMTGTQKKIDAYKMKGSQKIREYELTGAQKKIDAYRLMDSQKTREYNLTGAQKTDENSSCVKVRKNDGVEIIHECQRKRNVDVKPVVQDPMDDDRVPVESGTEMTPVPREPSEFEKQKHNLTHIPFQPWCTSCVKGKAQADPHKRTERIIEDSELPVIQCDYLMLKDTAGTGGLNAQHVCENIWIRHVHSC